jgi:hypothetical protein
MSKSSGNRRDVKGSQDPPKAGKDQKKAGRHPARTRGRPVPKLRSPLTAADHAATTAAWLAPLQALIGVLSNSSPMRYPSPSLDRVQRTIEA